MRPMRLLHPHLSIHGLLVLLTMASALTPPRATAACLGDCNADGAVTVDEVLTGVNIALGTRPLDDCGSFDADDSATVTVDELIAGLNAALVGCVPDEPTPTPSATTTPTRTATPTRPPSLGPVITVFGITNMDAVAMQPVETTEDGIPVFQRPVGAGFFIFIEGRSGNSGAVLGQCNSSYDEFSPALVPDIQILANRPLGQGNPAVCDGPVSAPTGFNCGDRPPNVTPFGGIPAVDPPDFDAGTRAVADALNDFGCRMQFTGSSTDACTKTASGNPRFVNSRSTGQFCTAGLVSAGDMLFHRGDTMLTARWRDQAGNVSDLARLIVRVP